MKKQSKITIANGMTVLAAFATFMCLFAINGITLQTVIAVTAACGCAYLTTCFFKVENILRKQRAAQIKAKRQRQAKQQFKVVCKSDIQAA
ncbi:MAG: hypothetical protein E7484_07755 [Ruminococcaceae bacterium]|nr:hypothetical protein [Oscillospiraceae bacterium]